MINYKVQVASPPLASELSSEQKCAHTLSAHLSYPRSLAAAAAATTLGQVTPTKSVQSVQLNKDSGFLNLKTIWAVPSSAHRGRCLAETSGAFAPPRSQKLILSHEENLESSPGQMCRRDAHSRSTHQQIGKLRKPRLKALSVPRRKRTLREGSERFLTFLSWG